MSGAPMIFGRYYPGKSWVHNLDPRIKLIAALVLMIVCFFFRDYTGMLAAAGVVLLLYIIARIPLGVAVKASAPLLVIALLTAILNLFAYKTGTVLVDGGFFTITTGGLWAAGFYGLRLSILVFLACLLTLTTPVMAVVRATSKLMQPLAKLGVPVNELSMMTGMAIRFLPMFAEELNTIIQARQARGFDMTFNPFKGGIKNIASLIIPLFVSAFRHAETISAAMDARCFNLNME